MDCVTTTPIDLRAFSADLTLSEDGIWYGPGTSKLSYPTDGNDDCFAVEDHSFWFQHRNQCITTIVRRFPPQHGAPIFDVGGGNGFVARGLEGAGFDVVLVEPGRSGAVNAKARGLRNVVCATTVAANFKPGSLPAVGLFDVIEHIEDAVSFLASIRKQMTDGGRLYATVPAYQSLWSADDLVAGHFRRYDDASLRRVLTTAGFKVQFMSYIFRPLPLPIYLLRAVPFRLGWSAHRDTTRDPVKDHMVGRSRSPSLISLLLGSEKENLNSGRPMRFGSSCLAVATGT